MAASKAPVEVTADDLMDDEWGPVKEKKVKKDKKGKSKKANKVNDEEEDEPEPEPDASKGQLSFHQFCSHWLHEFIEAILVSTPREKSVEPQANGDEAEADDGTPKVLSKKEKERLKKEKEKVAAIRHS